MRIDRKIFSFWLLCWSFTAASAQASVMPDVLIRQVVDQLIVEITERRSELEADHAKLYQLVDDLVVPLFGLNTISKLVLARNWKTATDDQRARFSEEFKTLLIRTYATALFEYTGREEMIFRPLQIKDNDRRTVVKTQVKLPDTPLIPVDYSFFKDKQGNWKIYDINIDGISLVTNYRNTYAQVIRDKGLDGLIGSLAEKNSKLN